MAKEFKLEELAAKSRIPARTIRLYIAQGLMPGPLRAGPNAAYGAAHLERLGRIRELQESGLTLARIRALLEQPAGSPALPHPSAVAVYEVAPDVAVHVKGEIAPWRAKAIRAAIGNLMRELDAARADSQEPGGDNAVDDRKKR